MGKNVIWINDIHFKYIKQEIKNQIKIFEKLDRIEI